MPDQMPVLRFMKKVFIKVKGTHPGVIQEGLLRDVPSCLFSVRFEDSSGVHASWTNGGLRAGSRAHIRSAVRETCGLTPKARGSTAHISASRGHGNALFSLNKSYQRNTQGHLTCSGSLAGLEGFKSL